MRPTTRAGRSAALLALSAIVALLWTLAPGPPAHLTASSDAITTITDRLEAVVAPGPAVPARIAVHERAGMAELGRALGGRATIVPVLAFLVLGLAVGSTGLPGTTAGWSAACRGRAPPLTRLFRPVR